MTAATGARADHGRRGALAPGCGPTRGPEWGPKIWERVTGEAANLVFAAASAEKPKQVEANWKRKATDEAKSS